MKIIGTHDELMMLKLNCLNKVRNCNDCIMQTFCKISKEENPDLDWSDDIRNHSGTQSPLELFTMEKIKTVIIGGDNKDGSSNR